MRCIFCKAPSQGSRSREHIVPESLGNTKHVLEPGIVCDGCNAYFAIKVEKPVLDSEYFTSIRFMNAIPNKRGRIPLLELVGPNGEPLQMHRTPHGLPLLSTDEAAANSLMRHFISGQRTVLYSTGRRLADLNLVARLLAKCALEIFAFRVKGVCGWQTEFVDKSELDPIRAYARFGVGAPWPYYERRIYPERFKRYRRDGSAYETMHEFDLLYTEHHELYAVICILGVELTINLGGRETEGYERWLAKTAFMSPLYPGQSPADPAASTLGDLG